MPNDDIAQYLEDGWTVGYDVSMEIRGAPNQDSDESDSDDGIEEETARGSYAMIADCSSGGESCSSSNESDDEEENEDVPKQSSSIVEENVEKLLECDSIPDHESNPDSHTSSSSSVGPFFQPLDVAGPLPPPEKLFIPHRPRDIEMDNDKINTITSIMASFNLHMPTSQPLPSDVDIKDLLEKIKK